MLLAGGPLEEADAHPDVLLAPRITSEVVLGKVRHRLVTKETQIQS